jgi:hypothetical protein
MSKMIPRTIMTVPFLTCARAARENPTGRAVARR